MRAQHILAVLLLVLPTQLTGITTTHHDKKTDPKPAATIPEDMPPDLMSTTEEKSNSSEIAAERQRRLIPYMTFYLTQDYNRPAGQQDHGQQYHLVPQKLNIQPYPDKYIVANYQPKYADPPPILYQPKLTYTPFLESNKLPGGFTPMRSPQPIRVQVLRGQKQQQQQPQGEEPNYSGIFDKLLHLKQLQNTPQYVVQPQYQNPKLSIATQYFTRTYGTPRPPSKVITFENFQSEPVQEARYKDVPSKTFIHTYTPANIDISTDNKVQNFENFESLKTYTQIPSPVTLKDYEQSSVPDYQKSQGDDGQIKVYQNTVPVKTYQTVSEEEYQEAQGDGQQVKVYQAINQKSQGPVPIKVYQSINQEEYTKLQGQEQPAVVYHTVNQETPNRNQQPVKLYHTVNQDIYQNVQDRPSVPVKVYQTVQPINVEDYPQQYPKLPTRPVKLYQQIYQQPGLQIKPVAPVTTYQSASEEKLQKPQANPVKVYHTINQEVYQQPEVIKTVGPVKTYPEDYQPVDTKASEAVSQHGYDKQEQGINVYQSVNQPEYQQPQGQTEPVVVRPMYRPIPIKPYQAVYQESEVATEPQTLVATENPHSLSVILKQLQESNTLPQTLTPDNIDNSIKTLVHILNALKHTQKFQRPIVVGSGEEDVSEADENDDEEFDDDILSGTVTQTYPANTVEGGTPGKPGVDYPAHANIPQTNFNCKKQRYKGFFGDPDTNCQVWHYCDLNGGQASFLCPNGTIFSQVALTCDWWYNVKCATTTQLYVLNERLYKYILPFTPKFPEDYSGPLVDRYLALKFKEMEEKMKKQKKGKPEKPAEVKDSEMNTLQDIEDESGAETQEHTTIISPDAKKNN